MWVQIRNSMAVQGIWYPLRDADMKCIRPDCQNTTVTSVAGALGTKKLPKYHRRRPGRDRDAKSCQVCI
jgi:hypothetical protein